MKFNGNDPRQWQNIVHALRSSERVNVPEGLAERAYRAAIAQMPSQSFVERFIWAARRALALAAVASALVWIVLMVNQRSAIADDENRALIFDGAEPTTTLWVGEDKP